MSGFEQSKVLAHIIPLRNDIFRLDRTAGTLTILHLSFVQNCLALRTFREALPILQATIHTLHTSSKFPGGDGASKDCSLSEPIKLEKLTTGDVHEYFLSGAMIYIGLSMWEEAKLYLEHVLVSPSQGNPTALMVEAYKKWVLVGCIIEGAVSRISSGILNYY